MFGGMRVGYFMIRNVSWRLVHHHRVGELTTGAAWVELGVNFGDLAMEAILSCGIPRTLSTVWYSAFKLKSIGVDDSK